MSVPRSFGFLPLGAIIQSFHVGKTNIVQGFPNQDLYQTHNTPYFGETIGRVANRLANGQIISLNQKSYSLPKNDGGNSIHGGLEGWGKKIWNGPIPLGTKDIHGLPPLHSGGDCVLFTYKSPDGDEGYPGTVEAKVFYTMGTQFEDGREKTVLGIEYEVQFVEDDTSDIEETVVNMTNHSYFNLGGGSTIDGTIVSLCSNLHLPVDKGGIPTTTVPQLFPGITPNESFTLGAVEPNIDHCFIVDPAQGTPIPLDSRSSPLKLLVKAHHAQTNIHLEVHSTEPAFQFYTGEYINVPAVEGVPARGPRAGFSVEPCRFIDAINREEWRDQVTLNKSKVYGCRTVYKGWSEE